MAKKKMNLKAGASRVASRAKKAAGKLDFVSILKANAGGLGAAFIVDKLDDVEAVQGMGEFAAPAIVEAGAIVLAMSGNKALEPVAYGMMGGAAAMMYAPMMDKMQGDTPTNGTNTIDASMRAKRMLANIVKRGGQMRPAAVPVPRMPMRQAAPGMLTAREKPGVWSAGTDRVGSWRRASIFSEDC